MDTLTITSIVGGVVLVVAFIIFSKLNKPQSTDRPHINIDFDTAKEREDKNRYFS